ALPPISLAWTFRASNRSARLSPRAETAPARRNVRRVQKECLGSWLGFIVRTSGEQHGHWSALSHAALHPTVYEEGARAGRIGAGFVGAIGRLFTRCQLCRQSWTQASKAGNAVSPDDAYPKAARSWQAAAARFFNLA